MKKIKKMLAFLMLLVTIMPIQVNAQQVQEKSFSGVEFVRNSEHTELPSYLRFNQNEQVALSEIKSWMILNFHFNKDIGFELIKAEPDNLGHLHYRYQQTYQDKPIEDAVWIIHTKNGFVYSMNGLIYKNIYSSASLVLTEDEALERAKNFVGADVYKWEMEGEEQHLKWEQNDPEATYFPKAELVYVSQVGDYSAKSFRLSYKLNIYAHAPLYRSEIYIDAISGEILRDNQMIHHIDTPGTAHTVLSGEQDIIADSFEGSFRLRDGSRGSGIRTFDMNQGTNFGDAVDFMDDDNDWNNINPQKDEYATDVHWGSEMTYDYFSLIHGRNSIDNLGYQLNNYVHYDIALVNAMWDGERMMYGDGGGEYWPHPLTSIEIVGHETTHGLISFTADLNWENNEIGGLNESFCDIFGKAIESYAKPGDWSWLIGEDVEHVIRSMSNPSDYYSPDTYDGDWWMDDESAHVLAGVQNHWFYLLTEGGTGTNDIGDSYSVTGIGMDAASAIAFRNLTVYLTPYSNYNDARFFAIQSAIDLYGACSLEAEQTTNAWYAVGVGEEYTDEVFANFTPSASEWCEAPFTVAFANSSINGGEFLWDFGDGSTSTDLNPIHTYTAPGLYDVKLTADGGLCGIDDTISVGAILVDPTADCSIILPTSGIAATQKSCAGTLFDSGGPTGDYGANEFSKVTIAPVGAVGVTLNFVEFDINGIWGCSDDNLKIYDGPNEDSPLIDTYCNAYVPSTINSSGSAITLVFKSDSYVNSAGFKMNWTCTEGVSEIDENSENEITIYPNPTNGTLTINTGKIDFGSIEITDALGKLIVTLPIQSTLSYFDFSAHNAKGIYFVKVKDGNGNLLKTEKVVLY